MQTPHFIAFFGLGILFLSACNNAPKADSIPEVTAITTPTTVPGPLSAGRLLAAQCAQCHGTDGLSVTDIDSLAGESKAELVEEMLEMKNKTKNDLMVSQAHGYTNQQINLIADYFSKIQNPLGND